MDLHLVFRDRSRIHVQSDLALHGKFDRVVQQIHQDLAQAARVADQTARDARRKLAEELQRFLLCLDTQGAHDLGDEGMQIEVDRLDRQLTGLDLGEIEDIVDDAQETVGR